MKLVIIGGPKTGKTTLAERLKGELEIDRVHHLDSFIGEYGWSELSSFCAKELIDSQGDYIIEGVQAVRALRKWLKLNETQLKAKGNHKVIYLTKAKQDLTNMQRAMAKGIETIFREIEGELLSRGVEIEKE